MSTRTFQSHASTAGAFFGAVAFFCLGLSELVFAPGIERKLAWAFLCLIVVALTISYGQAKLISNADGIEVRNPFSSYSIGWYEIEGFERGRRRHDLAVCLIRLQDGDCKAIRGIGANWTSGESGGERLAAELNEELYRRL